MIESCGYILAICSAIVQGSFVVPFKLKRIAQLKMDPNIFMLYVAVGVFLTYLLSIPFFVYNKDIEDDDSAGTAFEFSALGMFAGLLLVLSLAASFKAVECIGLALGQGIWSGIAILVSFTWGVVGFNEIPSSPVITALGLVVLMFGVVGIAFCQDISLYLQDKHYIACDETPRESATFSAYPSRTNSEKSTQMSVVSYDRSDSMKLSPLASLDSKFMADADVVALKTSQWYSGIAATICVGLAGGSVLAPLHYVPASQSGLIFLPSFGIGCLVSGPIVCAVVFYTRGKGWPPCHLDKPLAAICGLTSGFLWSVSNVFTILAIPSIGFAIAVPLFQCALLVSGIWGIFLFKEIRGQAIRIFFASGCILLVGALLLTLGFVV